MIHVLSTALVVALLAAVVQASGQDSPEMDRMVTRVRIAAPVRARAFPLSAVRVTGGPFLAAQQANARYLLDLEPDRLLSGFRKTAGLTPRAPAYGGWEAQGVAGHTLGHYLSACAMQFAASGDARFKERVDRIVAELGECQANRTDGFVAAIPDADRAFGELARGEIRSQGFDLNGIWVPWYTLHKLFAGLIDARLHAGSKAALPIACRLADWAIGVTSKLTDEQWQRMLACEHGGMNEAMANLYAMTGERRYLDLALRFHHRKVLGPLEQGDAPLAGLHGNTQIPKVIGCAREYEITGDARYRKVAETFWQAVVRHHSYVIGGHSDGEHFGQPDKLSDRLGVNTAETCNTYNMLKLTRRLFGWEPSVETADFYERALYNHILASQDPATGMVCYYVTLKPGGSKTYSTPFDAFWCCVGTGIENHTRYGEAIYFHDAGGVWVNLFIPSTVSWREKGVVLRQETAFPDEGVSRIRVECGAPRAFALRVRQPGWAAGPVTFRLNGGPVASRLVGGYHVIQRRWANGDLLQADVPMSLRTEAMPDNANRVALLWGPIVLAGDLGAEGGPGARVPALLAEGRPVSAWTRPLGSAPPTFRTEGAGRPEDVLLRPFFATHHRRYTVYWDLFTEADWSRREAELRAEEDRRRALEARTVDRFDVGEMQPERDHNLQGEKTGAGDFGDRKWRHAEDGGWFSFEIGAGEPGKTDLVLTYWGSDVGNRVFDVIVDGRTLGTQRLNNDHPGEFFDVAYALPAELTAGKQKVTVRLQAHEKATAGGLFGARTVRRG